MPALADQIALSLRRQGIDLSSEQIGELRGLIEGSQSATLTRALDAIADAIQAAAKSGRLRDVEILEAIRTVSDALASQERSQLSADLQAMREAMERNAAASAAAGEQESQYRQRALDLLERILPPLIAAAAGAAGVSYMVE